MVDGAGDRPVLVGVDDPEHVRQLVRTAGDLARVGSGTVRIVTVAVKSRDSPVGLFDDDTIRRKYATESQELLEQADPPSGVSVEREVVVARSVSGGLERAVEQTDPSALVVGWRGPTRRSDALLGTTVDRLLRRASCDLYVERVGREANGVESVLLPVAGGPHVGSAVRITRAIAARNDARVLVISVATPETDRGVAEAAVSSGRMALADAADADLDVDARVVEAAGVAEAIVAEAGGHDVVVLGATRRNALRRQLAGSVPRRVVDRTDRTLILARDGAVVGGPLHRLGSLLGR